MEEKEYPTPKQIDELRKIWKDPGVIPAYHIAQKNLLKKRWPLLWNWLNRNFGE